MLVHEPLTSFPNQDVPHRGLEKRAAANPYYKGKGVAIDLPDDCPVPDASWWANEESREDGIRKDSATTVDPLKVRIARD